MKGKKTMNKHNFYANLHTHSTYSDGGFSPKELVKAAKEEGYGAIAITDHDTTAAYSEIQSECEKEGLEYIFGTEFSSQSKLLNGGSLHIIGFHFDPEYAPLKKHLEDMCIRETDMTHALFDRGVRLGLIKGIEWEEVLQYNKNTAFICNEQVFRAMKHKGLVEWVDYFGWFRKSLFEKKHRDEVLPSRAYKQEHEVIELIHDAGGIAIVAHPHNQLCHMEALIEMGIEGLEAWHPLMTDEEKIQALKLAYDKSLYISGGSNHSGYCSGLYKRYHNISECPYYKPHLSFGTTKEYFEEIKNRELKR